MCMPVGAQAPSPLAFEVASIKPSEPGATGGGIRPLLGGRTYIARNVPVRLMIKLMYKITDSQISGGPDWMNAALFDIEARAPRASNIDDLHEMFKNLLAERFGLRFHNETRELPLFALTVDKSGSRMKISESNKEFEIPIQPVARGKITGERVPMPYFAWFLSQQLNQPVVDKTGLDRFYDFQLEWRPEAPVGVDAPSGDTSDAPDFFTALRQELGLKLEKQKGPVQVMMIDHLDKPSAN